MDANDIDTIISRKMAEELQVLLNHIIKVLESSKMIDVDAVENKLSNFIEITKKIINSCDDNLKIDFTKFTDEGLNSENEFNTDSVKDIFMKKKKDQTEKILKFIS